MNHQSSDSDDSRRAFEVLRALDETPGTGHRAVLARIYRMARQCPGLILLDHTSGSETTSAVLGSLESVSNIPPPRIYVVDSRRNHLVALFGELAKKGLAGEVTLYHGSLGEFFGDLSLRPALICIGSAARDLAAASLRANIPAGTPVVVLDSSDETVRASAAQQLLGSGILELDDSFDGGAVYHTTDLCQGTGFVPEAAVRVIVQGKLHERYFLSGAAADVAHTAATDLTEDLRREFLRHIPAAHGIRSWPYVPHDSSDLPLALPSGKPWPKISIVTPTRNQGEYIEQTILSVINQRYPNVEHIVVDGASTDDTPEILDRYRKKLALVISEPDKGQSDAVNKGMSKATGDILTWLNSDDMLAPGALAAVALAMDTHPADMIAGVCQLYRDDRLVAQHLTSCADGPLPLEDLLDLEHGWNAGQFFHQPEVMFTRDLWLRAGGHLDEGLYYSLDYELWLRFARAGARLHVIGRPLAWFRVHEDQKTYALSSFLPELVRCRDTFLKENGIAPQPPSTMAPGRVKLRITLLNDHGGFYGAGIAHVRLARALAWAGHDVNLVTILDTPAHGPGPLEYQTDSIVDRISATRPDLLIVGNLHNADADPMLLHVLSERFPTLLVLHDFWILTGRCAYTGACEKYLTGCDETCPTPDEYPALPPAEIADAWLKKRLLLGAKARPVLLANSEWTAAFARRALAAATHPNERDVLVEVFRLSFPLDLFRPRNKQDCREQLGLPLDRFLILVPASLDDPRKGARALIEAVARLEIRDVVIVTIGWPAAIVDCPIEVVQLGYINDAHTVAVLNSAVDIVVVPSSAETFGQVFIEAIACGTVVVGYPVAAVPEAIRDGVTGLLARDATPASLAAAIHHLYVHPELRNDLARWGRLYAENEWSEFSAYRQFFLALHRLGLTKSLDLRRKIGLLPQAPALPPFQSVGGSSKSWRPFRGFSAIESAVEHDLPEFRWAYGPAALAEINPAAPGAYTVLIAYRNPHDGQRLKVRMNGKLLGTYDLPNTGFDSTRLVVLDVTLTSERNLLHFELSRWYSQEENGRPLGIIITEILVEKVSEWDQGAGSPSSEQALAKAWGQTS